MSHQSDLIATDIDAYLKQHENKELLRFLTCGSVDDGKSTLIGMLLYESKMIYEDQLAAIERDSATHGTTGGDFDPALLTDGLKAEREQGITIDVAYRYFSTAKRKFIIADCPGHEQYTRNMATGASTCDLAIILIDARHGVMTQTKRHSFIVSLLGIKHVLVAINKMDLVDYSEERFNEIVNEYRDFATRRVRSSSTRETRGCSRLCGLCRCTSSTVLAVGFWGPNDGTYRETSRRVLWHGTFLRPSVRRQRLHRICVCRVLVLRIVFS